MPWTETTPVNERTRFIEDSNRGLYSMAALCRRYGISRKTGYKWKRRYHQFGLQGLLDMTSTPLSCPHKTAEEVVAAIIEVRERHPTWGAKKICKRLSISRPQMVLPARSTVCDILKRNNLIKPSRRRRKLGHPGKPTTVAQSPNQLWTADFKGHFKTRDGIYCYPLTIADAFSRRLLECKALLSTNCQDTKVIFERIFKEFGLPDGIRTDNGVPFATTAIARLSPLSVWWMRLGIYPELIELGKPQQNGSHERMHRTLKAETTRPAAGNLRAQQRRFNRFRKEYNELRPHEALNLETPASIYTCSSRSFPKELPRVQYPDHFERRLVSRNGGIRWNCHWVNVSHTLAEQYVGLEEIDDGIWDVFFGTLRLGRLDERDMKIEDALGRKARKRPDRNKQDH